MNQPTYEIVPHSGDLKIIARGRSLLEALSNASYGLVSQIVPPETIEEVEERRIIVGGEDDTMRVINFLNETLFLVYNKLWLPRRVHTMTVCGRSGHSEIQAMYAGEPFNAARHELSREVKAVTHHEFQIHNEFKSCTIEFVCDL